VSGTARRALATLSIAIACSLLGTRSTRVAPARVAAQSITPRESNAELPTNVLAEFATSYGHAELSDAVRRAIASIDGTVLAPRATFDWNADVGRRAIDDTDGVNQVASTLHAAAFFAGLPILARSAARRPSFYIKVGLEAAVTGTDENLVLANDRNTPVVIGMRLEHGSIVAAIRGEHSDRSVSFVRRVDAFEAFEEFHDYDHTLPSGSRVLVRRGIPGFRVSRERVIREASGAVLAHERSRDMYRPLSQVWHVGVGGEPAPGFVRPANDAHPEYIVDERLEMTRTEHGTIEVQRDAGRSGSYGWTAREGLLVHRE
jgi:hypothetical protein